MKTPAQDQSRVQSDRVPADDVSALVAQSVEQIFAEQVTPALIVAAERGEWPEALWRVVAEAGFDRAPLPESRNGVGSWTAATPVLLGIGRWQVPLPLAESIIARYLAALAGLALSDGPVTICAADHLSADAIERASAIGRIDATLVQVAWARHCRALLIEAPINAGEVALIAVPLTGQGVQIKHATNVAGEPRDAIELKSAPCEVRRVKARVDRVGHVQALGAFARSAMLAGALASALEQSVRYAGERVQFGRPIGKFQAIQQQLAVLAAEASAARTGVDVAAQSMPVLTDAGEQIDPRSAFDVAVAKIRAGEAATQGAAIAHAVHGAIGFTYEHRLHLATRRLWSWRAEFGSDAQWAAWLGRQAIAARGAGFWEGVTRRGFE